MLLKFSIIQIESNLADANFNREVSVHLSVSNEIPNNWLGFIQCESERKIKTNS